MSQLAYAPVVLATDPEKRSLHEAIIKEAMVPTRGKSSIGAESASDDATLLGVGAGESILVERRLIIDQRGRPLERTESRYAADRYGLDVGFSVGDGAADPSTPGF